MRLLISTDTAGGVWTFGREMVSGLLEAGDDVVLVAFGPQASEQQSADCRYLDAHWPDRFKFVDTAIPLEWMPDNERCLEWGEKALKQAAESFGPDLFHSNQFCYGSVELGLPKVVTAHSDVFSWAKACSRPLEPSAWLRRYRALVQNGLNRANAVVAPTEWMLQALQEEFAIEPASFVIVNGRTAPAVPLGRRQLRAVTAGRLWDPGKGLSVLQALQSPIPIAVAGEHSWEQGTRDLPVSFELHGFLGDNQLAELFSESAIYICASLYEPFGLAALEAALCGCAVVARDIPSQREVWGGAAEYFKTAEELSRLLTMFCEDSQRLEAARARSYERAQLYTRERMVSTYRELYMGVLEQGRARVA